MDEENEIETLKRIRMLARARQQKDYKNHKDQRNAKRREIYASGKAKLNPQDEEEGGGGYEEDNDQYEEPLENEIYQTDFTNAKSASYEDIVNALNTIEVNAGSREKYKQDIKRLLVLTKCENFIKCLKDYKKIILIVHFVKHVTKEKKRNILTVKNVKIVRNVKNIQIYLYVKSVK
jgi:hypothetical protein